MRVRLINGPESRLLGKPVPGGSYYKPRILTKGTCTRRVQEIDEADEPSDRIIQVSCLQWQWTTPLRECLELVNEEFTLGLLNGFVDLHSQSDDQILGYAREHGVLGLCACDHPRPFGHSRPRFNSLAHRRMCRPAGREPFDVWRKYSREAALTLRMAQLGYGGDADWNVANDKLEQEWRKRTHQADLAVHSRNIARKNFFRRQAQATAIRWIEESSGALSCIPVSDREVTIGVNCQTLFDVLAVQLLMQVTRADQLSACADCGAPIARRLKKGTRRIYCYNPKCKKKAKDRDAQKRARDRRRQSPTFALDVDPPNMDAKPS